MRTLVSALYLIKLDASSTFLFQIERLAELIHVNLVRYVTVSLWNEFSPGAARRPRTAALQAGCSGLQCGELVELYKDNTCKWVCGPTVIHL